MIPNIKENPRNRKRPKRGRKRFFNGSSLKILEKGEYFPRVICILALLCSHYKIGL